MFLRIYSGILFSTLISISCCYIAYQYINHVRSDNYTLSLFNGTLQLITEGVNRHQGKKQEQWLELVEKLIGLPITLVPIAKAPLSEPDLLVLLKEKNIIKSSQGEAHSRIWTQISDVTLLKVELKNIAEQQLRITAFLILNELGRYPQSKQLDQLDRLRQYFNYDINIIPEKRLHLDRQQQRRLESGDVVFTLDKTDDNEDVLMLYSRYKQFQQVLVIGPIPIYNASPLWLMTILLFLALGVTGLVVYLLVKTLERRMRDISKVVVNFGSKTLDSRVDDSGQDAISELATGINVMATRIQHLLSDQKDITQAISHELRTPISRMKFRVEILQENADHDTQEKLNKLKKDIMELDQLVEELLVFQLLDSSQISSLEEVHLLGLIRSVVDEIYEPFQSIEVILSLPAEKVTVYGRRNDLRRMIQNLLVNAFKHAKTTVKIELHAGPITLHINDDGEGIPEEQRARIFTPFVRLDSSRNRQTGGFGLGLAIIDRIVRLHKAQITVSESEMGGARFSIIFKNRFSEKEKSKRR